MKPYTSNIEHVPQINESINYSHWMNCFGHAIHIYTLKVE